MGLKSLGCDHRRYGKNKRELQSVPVGRDLRDHLDLGSKYKCKYKYISYQCSCYFTNQGTRLQRDLGDLLETCFIQNRVGLALQPVQNSSVPPPSLEDPGLPVV